MRIELEPTDLLIAPPSLIQDQFTETVIMLINHVDDMGTIGLCMNKPLDLCLSEVIEGCPAIFDNHELYWGGPAQAQTLWVLHSSEWSIENTIEISPEWSITSHATMFEQMEEGMLPNIMRVFMGYCAWDIGQLEMELAGAPPFSKNEAWLVSTYIDTEEMLDIDPTDMWEQACEISCSQAVDRVL